MLQRIFRRKTDSRVNPFPKMRCKGNTKFSFRQKICRFFLYLRKKPYFCKQRIEIIKKNNMKKQRIHIEHELKSNSPTIIWQLIGTPEGLARWIADEVTLDGTTLTLTWGETWRHHEIRKAEITNLAKQSYLRLHWHDDPDPEAYLELRMEYNELTDDYMLLITDFATEDDVDSLHDLWDDNLERLHQSSGL